MAGSGSGSDDYGMDFCRGMSMTMSMGGFQSALFSKSPADCITFLFVDWKLDRPGKFVLAMVCTFLLAVVSEGTASGQTHLLRNYLLEGTSKPRRKAIMTAVYGFQQLVGWMLMLISMTFSVELFGSVLLGLWVGKLLFPSAADDESNLRTQLQRRSSDDGLLRDDDAPAAESSPLIVDDGSNGSSVRRRRRS